MMRRCLMLLAAAAIAGLGAPVTDEAGSRPVLSGDRDGDGVFESLEAELAGREERTRVSVIVVLRAPASQERVRRLAEQVGGFTVSRRFDLITGFTAKMQKQQVGRLAALSEVGHVEANAPVRAAVDSAQSSFGLAQARLAAGVDGDADGSPDTYSKKDLVAAVIDSGIDVGHADLDEGKVIGWTDLVNGIATPYDDLGHGTAVAAVLAGDGDGRPDRRYLGVAPHAGLVGVKVLDSRGSGTVDDVVRGVEYAVATKDEYGIEAINLSLEQAGCSDGTDAVSLAVNAAQTAGLVVVAAAGNQGPGTCTIGSPGAAAKAVTIGAMSDLGANGFAPAPFSSRGKTLDGRLKPDVLAPGVSITTAQAGTSAGYRALDGTSVAAPFVTGLALLMRDANPLLGPQEVKDAITSTAVDWGRGDNNTLPGSTGADIDYGAGRLDGYAAVAAAVGGPLGQPPTMPSHELLEGSLAGTGSEVRHSLEVTDTRYPIAATLIHPSIVGGSASSPDFDLNLLGPDGVLVVSATTNRRQDALGFSPLVPGSYTLLVRSQSGGGDYFVDVSAGLPPKPPVNVQPPTILGGPQRGQTLLATDGVWTGGRPLAFTRQWQRCDAAGAGCSEIPGARSSSYPLTSDEIGHSLRVTVTASNSAGSSSSRSNATEVVEDAPSSPHPPQPLPPLPPPRVSAVAVKVVRGHRVVVRVHPTDCNACVGRLSTAVRGNLQSVEMRVRGPDLVGALERLPAGRWTYKVSLRDPTRAVESVTTRRLFIPRLQLRAIVRGARVRIVVRGAGCTRCVGAVWTRVRGRWRSTPLRFSKGALVATLRNVPPGRWPVYVSVRYPARRLEVSSEWQRLGVD
jgi:serine protease AprX